MYGFTTTLTSVTFDQAILRTLDALKIEGFGILSDIDVQQAMKEKLGKEMAPIASWAHATRRWLTRPSAQSRISGCCCPVT